MNRKGNIDSPISKEQTIASSISEGAFKKATSELESMVLKAFENKGYSFSTTEERNQFFKTEVRGIKFDQITSLYVGDTPICAYSEIKPIEYSSGFDALYERNINFSFQFDEL